MNSIPEAMVPFLMCKCPAPNAALVPYSCILFSIACFNSTPGPITAGRAGSVAIIQVGWCLPDAHAYARQHPGACSASGQYIEANCKSKGSPRRSHVLRCSSPAHFQLAKAQLARLDIHYRQISKGGIEDLAGGGPGCIQQHQPGALALPLLPQLLLQRGRREQFHLFTCTPHNACTPWRLLDMDMMTTPVHLLGQQ